MILLELKRYIRTHQNVTEENILNHFDISPDTLEGLIRPLIDQGHIKESFAQAACASGQCQSGCGHNDADKHYFWTDKRHKSLTIPLEIQPAAH
jgi:FeoC like transcriptional regulator.